ncbi:MAG: hypothetical protein ACREBH_02535 [Candidatus Micrarchaeaceae archaeon]
MPDQKKRKHRKELTLVFASMAVFLVLMYAGVLSTYVVFGAGGGTDAVTGKLTVNHYCSFTTNVDAAGITFGGLGGLNPGTNTIGTTNVITVTDTGNLASNILVSGSNWNYNSNSFDVENTVWSATTNTAFSPSSVIGSLETNEIYLTVISTDTNIPVNTLSSNSIFFGVAVPAGQSPGTYTQTINVISSC